MNDKEREVRIQNMKRQMKKEVTAAADNMQALTRIISNGTGSLIYHAITGQKK
jgi:hypothetical protein